MKQTHTMYLVAILLMAGLLSLWGCPKKAEVAATPEAQREAAASPEVQKAPATTQTAPAVVKSVTNATERAGAAGEELKPVYFDFDKSFIRTDAESVMQANAEWLMMNPKVKVRIEGNCDERGTIEYNQALGQRRAVSAKKYLTDMGVSAGSISLISYGKEKPICAEHTETCWQKNRRDDFVILK